jgi:hypothetical protein
VYARWLNKEDPGSYGTWYPGFVQSSRVSSDQSDYDDGLCGFPNLVYHVRFDDGVLGKDVKADDIMMQNQYEAWLKDLENYYSLPLAEDNTEEVLSMDQRVYAKWVDPTDPDMHARWIRGIIISSNVNEADGAITYHVKFADGDEDEELSSDFVLTDAKYEALLQQKIDQGRRRSVSGFDLIHAASKISSPIKTSRPFPMNGPNGGALIPELDDEDDDNNSYATIESELLCHEVLEPPSPLPTHPEDPSAPRIHYGLYMTTKPVAITPFLEPARNADKPKKQSNKDVEMKEVQPENEEKKSDDSEDALSMEHQENSKKADASAALVELGKSGSDLGLPEHAKEHLWKWLHANKSNPFPTKPEKEKMLIDLGLLPDDIRKLDGWFSRQRKKLKINDEQAKKVDELRAEAQSQRDQVEAKRIIPKFNPNHNPLYDDTTRHPSTKEVDNYLNEWLSRPENASNLNPNQATREQMEAESGIESRRIER